ncbi:unnamed protein product [Gordionus sp. m RMFG-2023]
MLDSSKVQSLKQIVTKDDQIDGFMNKVFKSPYNNNNSNDTNIVGLNYKPQDHIKNFIMNYIPSGEIFDNNTILYSNAFTMEKAKLIVPPTKKIAFKIPSVMITETLIRQDPVEAIEESKIEGQDKIQDENKSFISDSRLMNATKAMSYLESPRVTLKRTPSWSLPTSQLITIVKDDFGIQYPTHDINYTSVENIYDSFPFLKEGKWQVRLKRSSVPNFALSKSLKNLSWYSSTFAQSKKILKHFQPSLFRYFS